MKNLLISLVVLTVVSFLTSCSPSPEKQIVGVWTLKNTEMTNMDELIKKTVEAQTKMLDDSLKAIDAKIAAEKKADAKTALEGEKAKMEAFKKDISVEKYTEMTKKQMESMNGKLSFTFKEDKTYEASFGMQPVKGTYTISADGKTVTTKDETGKEEPMTIDQLSKTTLVVSSSQKQGEDEIKIKMTLEKK